MRALILACLIFSSLSFSQEPHTTRVPAKVYVYDQTSGPMTVAIGSRGLTALQALTTAEGVKTAKVREAWSTRATISQGTLSMGVRVRVCDVVHRYSR
jgi:hypothetical protein